MFALGLSELVGAIKALVDEYGGILILVVV